YAGFPQEPDTVAVVLSNLARSSGPALPPGRVSSNLEPKPAVVAPLVGESHRDPVLVKRPWLPEPAPVAAPACPLRQGPTPPRSGRPAPPRTICSTTWKGTICGWSPWWTTTKHCAGRSGTS